jgi:hypothetical protein
MDWPPIGSSLFPGRENVRQDREEDIGFQVSDIPPDFYRSIGLLALLTLPTKAEEDSDGPILRDRETRLSPFQAPFQEFDPVLERRT